MGLQCLLHLREKMCIPILQDVGPDSSHRRLVREHRVRVVQLLESFSNVLLDKTSPISPIAATVFG